jgi:negative regulator of sigma E activity
MSLKVSALLDGWLESREVEPALESIVSDPASRDRVTIYGLIGDALRGNSTPDDGYSIRILQRIREQAVQIDPGYDPLAD